MSTFYANDSLRFGYGYGLGSVTVEQNKTAEPDQPVKPQDPAERTGIMPYGLGIFPGFCEVPASSDWLFWEMRRYPAIVLAHMALAAQIEAGTRTIEIVSDGGKPDLAKKIQEAATADLISVFNDAIPGAMESPHFGRWLQEIIWGYRDGRTVPTRVMSFMPSEAVIHVDKFRQFIGYKVGNEYRDAKYAFLAVNAPHIDPILGYSRNDNAKEDWWRARQSNLNADKVERKASGIQMMLGVPIGSTFKDSNGTPILAKDVLQTIMNAAVQGQSFSVPLTPFTREDIAKNPALADIPAVKVEKFDWGQTGDALKAHLERLDRCDRNMIRAWHRPEREMTEGQHGTKAEAGVHGQLGVTDCELMHASICRQWDAQVTRVWMRTNFAGVEGIVIRTKPTPLSDPQQVFLQTVTEALVTNAAAGPKLLDNVDLRGLATRTELPTVSEEDAKKAAVDREAKAQQSAQQQRAAMGNNGNDSRVNDALNRAGRRVLRNVDRKVRA